MTSFPLLNSHMGFYSHRQKPHDTVPWLRKSTLTCSALPAHPLLPSTCHCMGTDHAAAAGEGWSQQHRALFRHAAHKVLVKAPASLLNAAALGRRVGCSSSECGSSHWWRQCCGAHPQLRAKGKN